jgi:hypothetical protein
MRVTTMGVLFVAYVLIAFGVCVGLITDASEVNGSYPISVVVIGSIFLGSLWPVYWAAKITQKLGA